MVHHAKPREVWGVGQKKKREEKIHVQLQQRPVGVAVTKFLLALLLHVALEGACCLGIVPLEAADDVPDVVRPLCGILASHFGLSIVGKIRGLEGGL
jgi:hypothetical protein